MEGFGGCGLDSVSNTVRKKRSNTSRRPRRDSQSILDSLDFSPPSSTPASENISRVSSDENNGLATSSRREFNLNQCASRASSANKAQGENSNKNIRKDDGSSGGNVGFHSSSISKGSSEHRKSGSDFKRSSEGAPAPGNWKSMSKINEDSDSQLKRTDKLVISRKNDEMPKSGHSGVVSDGPGNENKLRKVKLKVGGVTRTIHAKSSVDGSSPGSSVKSSRLEDISRPRPKLILQENSDDESAPPSGKTNLPEAAPWKDSSQGSHSSLMKMDEFSRAKIPEGSVSGKQTDKSKPVRKSKRVPKRRLLDGAFNDGDEDEEIRYLEKLKSSKVSVVHGVEYEDEGYEGGKKQRKISRISKIRMDDGEYLGEAEYGSSQLGRDGKNSRLDKVTEDTDYMEEEELGSDAEPESKMKKRRKEFPDSPPEGKKEMTLTMRQRALQSGKDTGTASLIEFPNGLPPAPSRKQKEKLSEVEQQLKKAEAAQRRRMQVEKANRESEAEAIRKILGQDSSRKKKEDKMKKLHDERAQERAANAMTLAPNTIRWVMGPTGTVVIFPNDVGLPSIFSSKPCSYPPPREKCAGPACTNASKYRDSKSKLPLCSLQCYRAVRDQAQPVSAC